MINKARTARLALLNATLSQARSRSPYYERVLSNCADVLDDEAELSFFPLLDRGILEKSSVDILSDRQLPTFITTTEGTSFGVRAGFAPTIRYWMEPEADAVSSWTDSVRKADGELQPLVLEIVTFDNGLSIISRNAKRLRMPLESEYNLAAVLHLLDTSFSFDGYTSRIRVITGPTAKIKLLTALALERDHRLDSSDVRLVSVFGDNLSPHWEALLRACWGAEVEEGYGMSEAPGVAARRDRTGRAKFVFMPTSVCELLDIDSDQSLAAGVGRLVVTTLLPFSQSMPLIRYDTGDIIDVKDRCETRDTYKFDFVGRKSATIFSPNDSPRRVLLSRVMIENVLDGMPDVVAESIPSSYRFRASGATGKKMVRLASKLDDDRLLIRLDVPTYWKPSIYPDRATELSKQIADRLSAMSPALQRYIGDGRVDFALNLISNNMFDAEPKLDAGWGYYR